MIVISWADLVLFGFGCGLLAGAVVIAVTMFIHWWEKRKTYARIKRQFLAAVETEQPLRVVDPVDVANAAHAEIGRRRGGRR